MNLLEEAKKDIDSYSKGGPISFADLIQYAGYNIRNAKFERCSVLRLSTMNFFGSPQREA